VEDYSEILIKDHSADHLLTFSKVLRDNEIRIEAQGDSHHCIPFSGITTPFIQLTLTDVFKNLSVKFPLLLGFPGICK